ncbi:MAG: DUF4129 domain-containing protein [Firmicutes bacterium]|nr:DUF4129 domain-containing protein [Bacillota bacterium]
MKKATVWDGVYRFMSSLAVSMLVTPLCYLFFYHWLDIPWGILWLFAALLSTLGFGMQTLYDAVVSSGGRSRGYREDSGRFSVANAAIPTLIAAVIAFISKGIFDSLFLSAYKSGYVATYTSESVYPLLGALIVFGLIMVGIVTWFIPTEKLISEQTIIPYFGISLVIFALSVMTSVPTGMLSASFAVFAVIAFFVMNQSYISRGVRDSLTSLSRSGRLYNVRLVLLLTLSLLLLLLVADIIVTGVSYFARLLFVYVTVMLLQSGDDTEKYYDTSDAADDFSGVAFEAQSVGDRFMIIVCIIFFIAALVLLITRGSKYTRMIIARVKQLIANIILFIMNARDFNGFKKDDEWEIANFEDEEIKLQNDTIESRPGGVYKGRSYRDFIAALSSKKTASEQIQLAYSVMREVFRERGYGVLPTYTPREAQERIHSRTQYRVTDITGAVEMVDYAQREPDGETCRRVITDMCGIIEKQIDE